MKNDKKYISALVRNGGLFVSVFLWGFLVGFLSFRFIQNIINVIVGVPIADASPAIDLINSIVSFMASIFFYFQLKNFRVLSLITELQLNLLRALGFVSVLLSAIQLGWILHDL